MIIRNNNLYLFINSDLLLWDIAINKSNEKIEKQSDEITNEKTLLFVGCQDSVSTTTNNTALYTFKFEINFLQFLG